MCLAVNPPPFDKGGKCDGAKQGIVRFWKGWCEARDNYPFTTIVRRERFGATGRASKASDKCSFAKVVEMERLVGDTSVLRQIGLSEY